MQKLRWLFAGAVLFSLASAPSLAADADELATLDLSPYQGKLVYVDFWASWCKPCRASFPWMNEMQAKHGEKGLVILGVNTGDNPADRDRFLERYPAAFEIIDDTDSAIARELQLKGMPSAFLFGPDGQLIRDYVGFNSDKAIELERELIERLQALPQ